MDVLYPVCGGLDMHKASVTACLRSPGDGPARRQEWRTFGTTTRALLQLVDWLSAAGCTSPWSRRESPGGRSTTSSRIASSGSGSTPSTSKMVPGRKTDVRDSEWLAQLLELGLLRGRFVPPAAQREVRDVVRYRKRLIEERAREANGVLTVLETANIKRGRVVTTVLGVSARAMLQALIAGAGPPRGAGGAGPAEPTAQTPGARRGAH